MPRGHEKEPGFKKLPNVPYRAGEMAPVMRDTDFDRGVLRDVPRDPIMRVLDYGGDHTPSGGTYSPASARHTLGQPSLERTQRETRIMPPTQLPGSYNTASGNGIPVTSSLILGEGRPLVVKDQASVTSR